MPFAVRDAVVAIIAETAAGPLAGEYVIDLGCGEGGLLIKLAWSGCRCEGMDILRGAIDTANANVAASMAAVRDSPPESAAAYRAPVFRVGDVFGDTAWWTDARSGVTVIVLFLVPRQVKKLTAELTQFLSAAPGRRVISYDYANGAFAPSFKHKIYPIYVYTRDSLKQPKVKVVAAEHAEVDPKRRYQSNANARRRVCMLQGVLNAAECSRVVNAVDAALLLGGIERTHSAFATDDVAAFRLAPTEYAFVAEVVAQRILPELAGNAQVNSNSSMFSHCSL
jgi:SAM-dependent methyltransferase